METIHNHTAHTQVLLLYVPVSVEECVFQDSPLRRRSPLQCVLTLQHQVDILIFHLDTAFPTVLLLLHDLLSSTPRVDTRKKLLKSSNPKLNLK